MAVSRFLTLLSFFFWILGPIGWADSSPSADQQPSTTSARGSEAVPAYTPTELRALVRKIETQHRGQTSHGKTRMRIVTKDWTRTLTMETWSEGRDRFLVRILEPSKERGTATLKCQRDIWNYFPKIDRLIKIPSSLMGDKWMGSHFTNDDLVKEDKIDELYDLVQERADATSIVIRATPRPDAAVVWGRLEYTIDREKEVPISVGYFDENRKKVRMMLFDQVASIGHRWVALRMRVQPCDTSNESTEFVFDFLEFDIALSPTLFSLPSLRKR